MQKRQIMIVDCKNSEAIEQAIFILRKQQAATGDILREAEDIVSAYAKACSRKRRPVWPVFALLLPPALLVLGLCVWLFR